MSEVTANVKAFLRSVYAATAEKEDATVRRSIKSSTQNRMFFSFLPHPLSRGNKKLTQTFICECLCGTGSASILSCVLSSRQGPGVELIQ